MEQNNSRPTRHNDSMQKYLNPSAEHGPHEVTLDRYMDCAPFESLLNIEIREASNGKAELGMPFLKELAQGFGLLHGGALASLADTAAVVAIKSLLPPGSRFATTNMQIEFLKPVTRGIVTAHARITHRMNRDLFCDSQVVDHDGQLVLNCSCRFRIARDVPADSLASIPASPAD